MKAFIRALGIDRLSIDERLALVQEIWNSIADERDVIPWEQIKASTIARLRKRLSGRSSEHRLDSNTTRPPNGMGVSSLDWEPWSSRKSRLR